MAAELFIFGGVFALVFGAVPIGLALLTARDREVAARWPAGWVVRRRLLRAEGAAFRSMRIERAVRVRFVRAGMPRALAATAGLAAMLAFVWLIAGALTCWELLRAAAHGALARPLLLSAPFCFARGASGFWLAAAAFQRTRGGVARAAATAAALDALVVLAHLRVSDSLRADISVAKLGLALSTLLAGLFALSELRRRGLEREAPAA